MTNERSGCLLDAFEDLVRSDFNEWIELAGDCRVPHLHCWMDESGRGTIVNIEGSNYPVEIPQACSDGCNDPIRAGHCKRFLVFPNRRDVRAWLTPVLWTAQMFLYLRLSSAEHAVVVPGTASSIAWAVVPALSRALTFGD